MRIHITRFTGTGYQIARLKLLPVPLEAGLGLAIADQRLARRIVNPCAPVLLLDFERRGVLDIFAIPLADQHAPSPDGIEGVEVASHVREWQDHIEFANVLDFAEHGFLEYHPIVS